MVNTRTFQLSCNKFWGYRLLVDLDYFDTTDEIVLHVKNSLDEYLRKVNLICLAEDLEKMQFHSPTIESILISNNPENIIYMCDHSHDCCGESSNNCEH